jgi:hypothetical protein
MAGGSRERVSDEWNAYPRDPAVMKDAIPVYTIALPEYTIEQEPDCLPIGRKLDKLIETHFPKKRIAIRGIGLGDHPGWFLDDLVSTILELGADRYDPHREAVHGDFGTGVPIDLHAEAHIASEGLHSLRKKYQASVGQPDYSAMGTLVSLFYGGALADRGYSIRLDNLMIYDLDQLEPAPIQWTPEGPVPGPPPPLEESCNFTFKHPNEKQKALLGVIKILR